MARLGRAQPAPPFLGRRIAVTPTGSIDLSDSLSAFSTPVGPLAGLLASLDVDFDVQTIDRATTVASIAGATDAAGIAGVLSHAAIAPSTAYALQFKFETGEYGVIEVTSEP